MKTVRKLLGAGTFLGLMMAGRAALACAACTGQSDSDMAKGMNAGIFVMLGFIGFMWCVATTFFVVLARKSAAVAKAHETSTPTV
jgi:hypothetical protein